MQLLHFVREWHHFYELTRLQSPWQPLGTPSLSVPPFSRWGPRWPRPRSASKNDNLFFFDLKTERINDGKMGAKMRPKWDQNASNIIKSWPKSWKRQVPKTCTWKCQIKIKRRPSKAWFSCPLPHGIVVSTFPDFLRMRSKLYPKALKIEACMGLWHPKDSRREFKKTCKKTVTKKVPKGAKMWSKRRTKKVIFWLFFGVWG